MPEEDFNDSLTELNILHLAHSVPSLGRSSITHRHVNVVSTGDEKRLDELRWLQLGGGKTPSTTLKQMLYDASTKPDVGFVFLRKVLLLICDKVMRRLLKMIGTVESLYNEWEELEAKKSFIFIPRHAIEQPFLWWKKLWWSKRSINQQCEFEIDSKLRLLKAIERKISCIAGKLFRHISGIEESKEIDLERNIYNCCIYIEFILCNMHSLLDSVDIIHDTDDNHININDDNNYDDDHKHQKSSNDMCYWMQELISKLPSLSNTITLTLLPYKRRSHIYRFSIHYALAGFGIGFLSRYLYNHSSYAGSEDLHNWGTEFRIKMDEFVDEHLVVPCKSIYAEFFKRNNVDIEALENEVQFNREALRHMLLTLAEKKYVDDPSLLETSRFSIDRIDAKWVLKEHSEYVSNPYSSLVSGELISSLLIQVQKLKLEIDEEMLQLDKLVKANEINIQLAATFPVVMFVFSCYRVVKSFIKWKNRRRFRQLYGREKPWTHAAAQLRRLVRILTFVDGKRNKKLSDEDQGYVLYAMMKLESVASHELHGSEREQLLEDLDDMRSTELAVRQKLLITERIYHSFPQFTDFRNPDY